MPCSCRDCQGPWEGWPALQPPLLALRLRSSHLCSAPGPHHVGCHWEEDGWAGRTGRNRQLV